MRREPMQVFNYYKSEKNTAQCSVITAEHLNVRETGIVSAALGALDLSLYLADGRIRRTLIAPLPVTPWHAALCDQNLTGCPGFEEIASKLDVVSGCIVTTALKKSQKCVCTVSNWQTDIYIVFFFNVCKVQFV